jgi:Flp pilus assembly protein TadG
MLRRATLTAEGSRRWGWSSGQAIVEFPIAALLTVIFTLAIVVGGVAIYSYNFVSQAARDAVRYASVNGATSTNPVDSSDVKKFVLSEATGLNSSALSVSTSWNPDNKPGGVVSVSVTYNFQPFYPMTGTTLPLSSSSQMVISK